MQKIIKPIVYIIIILFTFSIYGWMVHHITKGNKNYGFITEPIKQLYSFPDLFKRSVKEVKSLPATFIKTPDNFKPINKLTEDVYALMVYSDEGKTRSIVIRNLKNDSILQKWTVKNPHIPETRIFHPLYLPDGSIVYSFGYQWFPMRRIDSAGNVIWKQNQFLFHHGMELNKDGDIWACTRERVAHKTGVCKIENKTVYYIDYTFTKLDIETGKVLFHKSISELLKENNLTNYLLKAQNIKDAIHLNDVQPALKTTAYYNEDDVFLSLRSLSCIIHYRPSTNKIIRIIEGPFVNQHDVDILDDHTLTIFNNNFYSGKFDGTKTEIKDSTKVVDVGAFYSNIVSYDLQNGEFSIIGDSIFRANKISTRSEGLQEFIDKDTYFVEQQNSGVFWIVKDDTVIYKNVFPSQHKGYHHLPNWTRIIKNYK